MASATAIFFIPLLPICHLCLACQDNERQALLTFKQSLTDDCNLLSNWRGADCCRWREVGCSKKEGNVIKLSIGRLTDGQCYVSSNYFDHSLSTLKYLQHLDLSNVTFSSGDIQQLVGSFTNLRFLLSLSSSLVHLNLSSCSMNGPFPRSLKNLTSLRVLDLSYNYFNGSLPKSLGNLSQLEALDLTGNFLLGSIPGILQHLCNLRSLLLSRNYLSGNMSRMLEGETRCKRFTLEELDLSFNQLNGSLPDWVWQMQHLSTLDLSYNSLDGVISDTQFVNMTELKILRLSGNRLIFNTASTWVPPFKLNIIDLGSCRLGPRFPTWLRTQRGFQYLNISNAFIFDKIPSWFWDASYAADHLKLSHNKISGDIHSSLKFLSATTIDICFNLFQGKLPSLNSNVKNIFLDDNLFSGDTQPILNAEMLNLRDVTLSKNLLSGEIPSAICNFSSMQLLDLSNNNISGNIPECQSNKDSPPSPYVINLANNYLSGSIPQWMAGPVPQLTAESHLTELRLNNNSFDGEIPSFLRYCNRMTILDLGENKLTGKIPSWIGEGLSSLKFLRLRSNMLTGKIPQQLSYLTSLQMLDLAQNNLSGTIPNSFKNFSAMTKVNRTVEGIISYRDGASPSVEIASSKFEEIIEVEIKGRQLDYTKTLSLVMVLDLSCNNLSGEIPIELMDLIGLQSLNLSKNQLEGYIPDKFGGMAQLEALDLSMNHLSGKIPGSIVLLTALSYLNLSHNDLSGRIPSGNQIQTLTDPSIYAGNSDLCGSPLPRCPGDEHSRVPTQGADAEDEDGDSDMFELYLGMGIGFAVGWWVICGAFIFKNSWRVACFQYYDDMENNFIVKMDTLRRRPRLSNFRVRDEGRVTNIIH
ncbi:leucine-rich repeat receptor protein kinase EMS1-like isoform X3 [Asparagus officinalis]|uniref:leucine-rich repeat receptor protein kinase EMS1-like isoform X3 n=1 Tax=Asparagus officinalis TaxID=4686 RepID=UPI00098E41F5|nr:leucine-rich repeat receptor protein kinase EMS1-like isoform X3 [Asparagus officinalis]